MNNKKRTEANIVFSNKKNNNDKTIGILQG